MDKGKEKCEILKAIRAYVAEKYGLDYTPSACNHQGKCHGTCPKCDTELESIQSQLEKKGITDITNDTKLIEMVENYQSKPANVENDDYMSVGVPEPLVDIYATEGMPNPLEGDVVIEEGLVPDQPLEGDARPYPIENRKLFLECNVAGAAFHNIDDIWDELYEGAKLVLVREKDNAYDEDAIAVALADESNDWSDDIECGPTLGYIPRKVNKSLATLLDMGWQDVFEAEISELREHVPYSDRIHISIYIKNKDAEEEHKPQDNRLRYVIGSEPLHEWERRNNYPSCIVLTGNVSANTFSEFAHDFDYTKYKQISLDELFVEDMLFKDGHSCTYEDYLSQFVCEDAIRLFVPIKLYLNLQIAKSFVVYRDCVYSADYKTLVHAPETTELVVLPFVEHIGNGACCGYDKMSVVKLNNGLKSIGKWSFVAADINKLELPHSLVSLGEKAFLMSELESVRLSDSLEGIPDGCFDLCSLDSIEIPHSVKYIGNKSLRGLIWTDEIEIPEGVERIGYDAFEAMDHVSLPSTLLEIAPDFYYEECIDDPDYPPYIEVHPDNKVFFSKDGSLYFKETGAIAIDSTYHGPNKARHYSLNPL